MNMTLTHHDLLNSIKSNLDTLSKFETDFLDPSQNSNLLSSFKNVFDLTSQYIMDTSKEDSLVEEFVKNRKELSDRLNKKLEEMNDLSKELNNKLEIEREVNKKARENLQSFGKNYSDGDFRSLINRQEMVDKLKQWKHSCDLESLDIKNLKCKIDILEEKFRTSKYTSSQDNERNRLFYELLSSALKLTILNIDEKDKANLAILSESKLGNEQTWHRFSSPKECDVDTCDFLWNLVENSLSCTKHELPQDPNTPKLSSVHLSSKSS